MVPAETAPSEHQVVLNDLKAEAQTPEDQAQVKAWQNEISQMRQKAMHQLGTNAVELIQQPDGTIATGQETAHAMANGQEASGLSTAGRRV